LHHLQQLRKQAASVIDYADGDTQLGGTSTRKINNTATKRDALNKSSIEGISLQQLAKNEINYDKGFKNATLY